MSNRVRLLSTGRYKHEGKPLKPDDEFETDEQNAADLVAMGFAIRLTEDKRRANTYRRRDMQAE